ncbi:MAG: glycoside hydrolase [Bifidobacteriaceae bacterium]|jgi:hypothetical protein|nr:glycoside hydrolase [Bifidobacteriaceae bacterium]
MLNFKDLNYRKSFFKDKFFKNNNSKKIGVLGIILIFGSICFVNTPAISNASASQSVLNIAKGGTNANSAESAQINLGRTDSISSNSTDNQFPSSKAVYDYINLQFPEFAALDTSGNYIYSHDGLTWSEPKQIANGPSRWLTATYGGGQFIAAGSTGKITTSKDGITWTEAVTVPGAESISLESIAFGNNYFLVSGNGIIARCLITTDCSISGNWSVVFSGRTYGPRYIAFGNGRFWASWEANFLSTNNGESWTMYGWPSGTGWSSTIFYALGYFWTDGDNSLAKCPEGSTTWINTGFFTDINGWTSGSTDGNQTIVMSRPNIIAYSKDSGNSFTTINVSDTEIYQLAYKNGFFWGITNNKILYSSDGITWQSKALPSGTWLALAVK